MFNKICNLTHSEDTFTWALTFAPQDRKGHVALQQAGDFSVPAMLNRWNISRAAGTSLVVSMPGLRFSVSYTYKIFLRHVNLNNPQKVFGVLMGEMSC